MLTPSAYIYFKPSAPVICTLLNVTFPTTHCLITCTWRITVRCHNNTLVVLAQLWKIQAVHLPCKTWQSKMLSLTHTAIFSPQLWQQVNLVMAYLYVQQVLMRSYISSGQFTGLSMRFPPSIICITSFPFMPCGNRCRQIKYVTTRHCPGRLKRWYKTVPVHA